MSPTFLSYWPPFETFLTAKKLIVHDSRTETNMPCQPKEILHDRPRKIFMPAKKRFSLMAKQNVPWWLKNFFLWRLQTNPLDGWKRNVMTSDKTICSLSFAVMNIVMKAVAKTVATTVMNNAAKSAVKIVWKMSEKRWKTIPCKNVTNLI